MDFESGTRSGTVSRRCVAAFAFQPCISQVPPTCLLRFQQSSSDDVQVGENSIVGALCFVPAYMIIPAKSLVVGNPAKIIKEVSDEMIDWKTQGTKLYQQLPTDCHNTLRECEPLREKEPNRPEAQQYFFKTWADKKVD